VLQINNRVSRRVTTFPAGSTSSFALFRLIVRQCRFTVHREQTKARQLMKVVILCGGLGTRLREETEYRPKPMVPIGGRPILWHIMKLYAHYGHKEFILCLGYKADVVKKYFLHYDECVSNNFVLTKSGQNVELLSSDISDWKITFVDTGLSSNIGQRLRAVEKYLQNDEVLKTRGSEKRDKMRLKHCVLTRRNKDRDVVRQKHQRIGI
jgi:glucose-1-phosphate cytidylyltransferase